LNHQLWVSQRTLKNDATVNNLTSCPSKSPLKKKSRRTSYTSLSDDSNSASEQLNDIGSSIFEKDIELDSKRYIQFLIEEMECNNQCHAATESNAIRSCTAK